MRIKVCGMGSNVSEVAGLQPDYLGFIFWEPSKRYYDKNIPAEIGIEKVGVFVDESPDKVLAAVGSHGLNAIQFHGRETADYCMQIKQELAQSDPTVKLIKAFAISPDFDFESIKSFESHVNFFLFDAKGDLPGGNGIGFRWELLRRYTGSTPYFLSGGIGPNDPQRIRDFMKEPVASLCHAIDVNSRFEIEPGLKNIESLKPFIQSIRELGVPTKKN